MGYQSASVTYNIVARLVSWGKDDIARVELLTDAPGAPMGAEMSARIAEDYRRRQLIDFAFRRRQGLKVSGAVLLRKSVIDPEKGIVCKEVDVMRSTQKDGPCVVKRNSAVYIHAPESSATKAPKYASIALLAEARRVKTIAECVEYAKRMVEDAAIFGVPSLLLTMADPSGRIEELPITIPEGDYSQETIEAAVKIGIDSDSAKMMAKSRKGWWLVPIFKAELEPEPHRRGKLNAQYANIQYGSPDEPMWTRTNAVLRGEFSDFIIADVSPISEPADVEPKLLVDLLEK